MAIDTAAKRKSCIGIGLIFLRTGVIPDGTNLGATGEREHADMLYSGLSAVAASVKRLMTTGIG